MPAEAEDTGETAAKRDAASRFENGAVYFPGVYTRGAWSRNDAVLGVRDVAGE